MSGLKSKEALARSPRRPGTPRERAEPRVRAAPAEVVPGSGEETRRLVRLVLESGDGADDVIDMLLAKGRAADRRAWLEQKGNQAEVIG